MPAGPLGKRQAPGIGRQGRGLGDRTALSAYFAMKAATPATIAAIIRIERMTAPQHARAKTSLTPWHRLPD
jgi:hypothetical protein